MKSALLLLSGISTTVTLLIGGLAFLQAVLPDETPHHFAGLHDEPLWTSGPISIANRDTQTYERIAASLPANTVSVASLPPENKPDLASEEAAPGLDQLVTSALEDATGPQHREGSIGYAPEHVDWCEGKYRSYREKDNSYLAYSGARRTCVSPFGTEEVYSTSSPGEHEHVPSGVIEASLAVYQVSEQAQDTIKHPRHTDPVDVSTCAERYRSYRARDNSYLPFVGGQRMACEIRSF